MNTTAAPVPTWFHNRVLSGLQFMLSLGLNGTPAAEVITLTAQAWITALWNCGLAWDEAADNARLERAFMALAVAAERWPGPRALLQHMPPRAPAPRLPPPPPTSPSPDVRARLARHSRRWDDPKEAT